MRAQRAIRSVTLAALMTAACAGFASAQSQQGTITGRVTDASTGRPIPSVQLSVIGTNLGTQSNAEGQYTIRGVGAGSVELRALRVGYTGGRQTVTVTAGGTTTADFSMQPTSITLSPVVTTATGEQRRVAVGNAVSEVNAAEVTQTAAVTNVGDIMTSRAAGVMVIPGTQTGAGTRVRIRGTSSLSLSNNPIYFIDGVRVETTTGSSSVSVGGTTPSRLGDLNPEEIESIEIVKGPSAATLYGTDAANGVVVIKTKRGLAGQARWTYYTEQTAINDIVTHPTAYRGWRNTSTPSNTTQCLLSQVASGACVQDSVTSYNLFEDPQATPFGTGYRQQHGLQLSGGSEAIRYFLSGEWEDEDGVTQVPPFEKRFMAAHSLKLRPEEQSPNRMTRETMRANLNITLPQNADIAVSAGYTSEDLRLPQSDDSGTDGILGNTYGGPGYKYNLNANGDTLYGWRQFTPRDIYQQTTKQGIERFIGSVSPNWRPEEWLAFRGNFGIDYINRQDEQICRFQECPANGDNRLGFKIDNRTNFFTYTADAAATATRRITDVLESKTTFGAQFYRSIFSRNGSRGGVLPPGATTVTAGAVLSADETTTESRTFGGYVEQNFAYRDRLFVTAGVRSDRNSAFGADFSTAYYPKLAVSWVISDEAFFPTFDWVNQLRLRSAYGASGVQPGTTDAVQYFSATSASLESGDAPGVVFTALGNRHLKPERSTELEVGVDGTFWNNRVSTELTYYNKKSRDALIQRILAPSLGTGATSRFENIGQVSNTGWEMLINAQLLRKRALGWDVTLNGSTNDNRIVALGESPTITISSTQQHVEGYPLYGWWVYDLQGYEDKNGDGIISYNADPNVSEIQVSASRTFVGRPLPKVEAALTNGFDFLDGKLRLSGMLDYKGGHKVYNNSERIRCASRLNCEGLISPNASLFEQARTIMVREHPTRSVGGFIEDGDFIRFRELSLTYNMPEHLAARFFRGRSLGVTLAARNLGIIWTKYTGTDPEAFGTTGDAPSSFQAFAPPRYLTFRLNLGL
jgi:TonB-linked SusC/RagA family outer membrane protein